MNAHAEFATPNDDAAPTNLLTKPEQGNASKNSLGSPPAPSPLSSSSADEFCDYDYVFGDKNKDTCNKRALTGTSNLAARECEYARKESGANKTQPSKFMIGQEWFDSHPPGCFADKCQDQEDKWCYYINEDGATPKNPTGYPVCKRWKYIFGNPIKGKNVSETAMCTANPKEYKVIDNEEACRKAANCLGDCAAEDKFVIGEHDISDHDRFPPGCFLHVAKRGGDRRCVSFNPPRFWGRTNAPADPVGYPICVVQNKDKVSKLKAPAPPPAVAEDTKKAP